MCNAFEVPQRQHNEDRIRRAESWRKGSEGAAPDSEEKFIFLWIAFNAAYGAENVSLDAEADKFRDFLERILHRDENGRIEEILWTTFSGPIRVLLTNKYVFLPFWKAVQGLPAGADWQERFDRSNGRIERYISRGNTRKNTHRVLFELFLRLYTLRNQILHGGVTFKTGWGRDQIRDCSRIMASLVPAILEIMRADIDRNPDTEDWGRVAYPRTNNEPA